MEIKPIAHIYNGYSEKFGIPRQAGMVENLSHIRFEKEFSHPDFIRGIEEFSHLWIIWQSREETFHPTVRPPKLGGNERRGVFATRSPFRPNRLCLSCVKLEAVREGELIVSGADVLSGTEIYDIKPYLAHFDKIENAKSAFSDEHAGERLTIANLQALDALDEKDVIRGLLECDPRPAYQADGRVYRLDYGSAAISFSVKDNTVTVLSADKK